MSWFVDADWTSKSTLIFVNRFPMWRKKSVKSEVRSFVATFCVDIKLKSQLILKCLFGVFNFFQQTNENTLVAINFCFAWWTWRYFYFLVDVKLFPDDFNNLTQNWIYLATCIHQNCIFSTINEQIPSLCFLILCYKTNFPQH